MLHLLGVLQRGVSVVGGSEALQQAAVKPSAVFYESPRHGQLLFQHFIECKNRRVEGAES